MLLQAAAELLFTFADPRIDESSGLAASSTAEAYFTVDDSNPDLRFFTVDGRGRTLAVTDVPGQDCRDLEDLALGPGPSLYLADIGDNRSVRPRVLVHRLPEPAVDLAALGRTVHAPRPETFSLTYDDGPHDAETLLVHPRTGQVVVVTKGPGGSEVYAAPQPLASGVLRHVGSLPVGTTGTPGGPDIGAVAQTLVTGGAVSPDGRRLVLRTYTDAYVYEVPGDDLVAALAGTASVLPLPETRQGEAVTWTRDGAALLTSSEGVEPPVHRVAAPLPTTATQPATAPPATARPTTPRPGDAASDAGPHGRGPGLLPVVAAGVLLAFVAGVLARARRHR